MSQSRFKYSSEINLGHVIQIVIILTGLAGFYFNTNNRLGALEQQAPVVNETLIDVIRLEAQFEMAEDQRVKDVDSLKDDLKQVNSKLDRLIEREDK